MSTRSDLTAALNGETPEITPLSIYAWLIETGPSDDWRSDKWRPDGRIALGADPRYEEWRPLIDRGLGVSVDIHPIKHTIHGVEDVTEEKVEHGHTYRIDTRKTPVGSVRQVFRDGWPVEHYIKQPRDYKVMQWAVEHTEVAPDYDQFSRADDAVGEDGIVTVGLGRSPAQTINVEWAGLERFAIDVAMEVPELFDLYQACVKHFMETVRIAAAGPGRFVKLGENLTSDMYGPERYRQLVAPVYAEAVPILGEGGKRLLVHYDGPTKAIAQAFAETPAHGIESLTEPPEGDQTYDQCRAIWPDKVFWGNINLGCYALPPDELQAEVIAKRNRAGKKGLAFEISEDIPKKWRTAIPTVLAALRELA